MAENHYSELARLRLEKKAQTPLRTPPPLPGLLIEQQREIEHLREKVREMDALVREKDRQLEAVFNSPTFKAGKTISGLLKGVLPLK